MRLPSWMWNPQWQLVTYVAAVLAAISWLISRYLSGAWTPEWLDVARAAAGLFVGWLWELPEHLQYQTMGDEYVRALLSRRYLAHLEGRPGWWVVASVLFFAGFWVLWIKSQEQAVLFAGGMLLGVLIWLPLRRAVWKRMWVLYRQEAAAATAAAPEPTS